MKKLELKDILTLLGFLVSFAVSWGMIQQKVNAQDKDLLELRGVPADIAAIRADQAAQLRESAEIRKDVRELREAISKQFQGPSRSSSLQGPPRQHRE